MINQQLTNYDILNQPKMKAKILNEMSGLVNVQGWLYLTQILEYNVYIIEQQILNDDLPQEKMDDLKLRRKYLLKLKDFPNKIIMKIQKDSQGDVLSADPYE
jgi:hypothetical protein